MTQLTKREREGDRSMPKLYRKIRAAVCFRMDDITPDMCWDRFNRFRNLFDEFNVKPLIGVVPDNRDPKLSIGQKNPRFWDCIAALVNDRGWSLAQHGSTHEYHTSARGLIGTHRKSEFAGLSRGIQQEIVCRGREILEGNGLWSSTWMAPSHSYDCVTLDVIRDLGFKFVSDGYSLLPYKHNGRKFVPCQMAMPRLMPVRSLVTCCIHSNTTTDIQFERYARFMRNERSSVVDYSEATQWPCALVRGRILERMVVPLIRARSHA